MTPELKVKLTNSILRIIRSVFGLTIKADKVELLNQGMDELVEVVGKITEAKAIEVCKKIQEATKAGFEVFAEEVEQIKQSLKDKDQEIQSLQYELKEEYPEDSE